MATSEDNIASKNITIRNLTSNEISLLDALKDRFNEKTYSKTITEMIRTHARLLDRQDEFVEKKKESEDITEAGEKAFKFLQREVDHITERMKKYKDFEHFKSLY